MLQCLYLGSIVTTSGRFLAIAKFPNLDKVSAHFGLRSWHRDTLYRNLMWRGHTPLKTRDVGRMCV